MKKNKNTMNKNNLLYSEGVPIGKFAKITTSFVFLFFIVIAIITSALYPQEMRLLLSIVGGICIFIFFMYWNYSALQITLTKNQIKVGYRIFNYKIIPLRNIISCETTKVSFRKYGGVGIRLGLDGSCAYNTNFGEAVKLISQNRRPFVFSTRNPQIICDLINELALSNESFNHR